MHAVIETPTFLSDARGLSEDERGQIVEYMSRHPLAGEPMRGTGGARKVRIAGRGKGKSGGYRVITYYGGEDVPVFLLVLFSKGERANLTQAERNELRSILGGLADDYRVGVKKKLRRVK
jgi:hypothetical protein